MLEVFQRLQLSILWAVRNLPCRALAPYVQQVADSCSDRVQIKKNLSKESSYSKAHQQCDLGRTHAPRWAKRKFECDIAGRPHFCPQEHLGILPTLSARRNPESYLKLLLAGIALTCTTRHLSLPFFLLCKQSK